MKVKGMKRTWNSLNVTRKTISVFSPFSWGDGMLRQPPSVNKSDKTKESLIWWKMKWHFGGRRWILLATIEVRVQLKPIRNRFESLLSKPLKFAFAARTSHVIAANSFLDDDTTAGTRHGLIRSHHTLDLSFGQAIITLLTCVGVDFVVIIVARLTLVVSFTLDTACFQTNRAVETDSTFIDLNPSSAIWCFAMERILSGSFGIFIGLR